MSDGRVPSDWRRVKFGEVVRKVGARVDPHTANLERYVAGEHMDTDDLKIRRWGEVGDGYLGPAFNMRFRPRQVLYGSRRTYLRKVAFADFEGICANTTFVLEPRSEDLLPEFLPLVMTTEAFHDHSIRQSKGSVNPYINFSDITWYEFALPPIGQQERLIEFLGTAERARSALTEALKAARHLRESLVSSGPSTQEIPLGDLLLQCDYGLSTQPQISGEVPILRMNNLLGGELDLADLRWLDSSAVPGYMKLEVGDVLFNRTNSVEHVGKVALVEELGQDTTFASYLLRLRVDSSVALPGYVCAFLQSSGGRRRIEEYVTRGVSQANVNATNLKKIRVPVPTLDKQRELVERWVAVRSLIARLRAHGVRAAMVSSELREAAMSGDLNVQ